jgi:hypothetical protein
MSQENYADLKRSGRTFSNFLWKIEDLRLDHIHELTISHHHVINDSNIIDRLCRLFTNLERLDISIESIDPIIQVINNFDYLSSVSFQFKCSLNNQLIIDRIEDSIISTFTYRFTKSSVHIWINKNLISSKDRLEKQEYMWNKRSILSIILSCILINLLSKISINIWNYILGDRSVYLISAFHIFQPIWFHLFAKHSRDIIQENERNYLYIFGYIFVGVFQLIAYKYSIFNNEVNQLSFNNRLEFSLTIIGCILPLIIRHNMGLYHQWIISLISFCLTGLCVILKLFCKPSIL